MSDITPADWPYYYLLLRMKGHSFDYIGLECGLREEDARRAVLPLLQNARAKTLKVALRRYQQHRQGARKRGIEWAFEFDDWWAMWRASGHYGSRGPTGHVMARIGDVGPYAAWNVRICTSAENIREANCKFTDAQIRAIRSSGEPNCRLAELLGVSRPTISDIRTRKSYAHIE